MNHRDLTWLKKVKHKYPEHFKECKVLELGSQDINGNFWDIFDDCDMTGVDWQPGKNVTHVMKAHETDFEPEAFDTLISFNHLEHDPYWQDSLSHNFPTLKKDGLLVLRWADEQSAKHSLKSDPSGEGGYYPKGINEVLDYVNRSKLFRIVWSGSEINPAIGTMSFIVAVKTKSHVEA